MCCEAQSSQVNYLIDESDDVGKGANTTISFVHHYTVKNEVLRYTFAMVFGTLSNMLV